jgi:molecular chaperone HscB
MQYFEQFGYAPTMNVDADDLRKRFLKKSRLSHPDRFANAPEAEQAAALAAATLNNEAYRVLADFDLRLQYLLTEKGLLDPTDSKSAIPQAFLVEMMDINEGLQMLQKDYDDETFFEIKYQIRLFEKEIQDTVNQVFKINNLTHVLIPEWEKMKLFYLKRRYLLRISKRLSTFATQ